MAGLLNLIKQKLGYTAPQQNVFGSRVNPDIQRKFYAEQEDPRQAFRSELNPKKVAERALVKARRSVDPEKRAKLVDIARKVGQTQIPDLGQKAREYFAPAPNLRARDVVREIGQTVGGLLNNPTLENKLKNQGVNPTLASFMSNYGGSAGTIKKSGKKVVDKVTGKLITLPETKTPRVTATQGRAQLTGKAAETPTLTLEQRAQGFADAMGAGRKKAEIPTLDGEDAKFSTDIALGTAEDKDIFRNIFNKWVGKQQAAETRGSLKASAVTDLPAGNKIRIAREAGDKTPDVKRISQMTDQLFNEAKAAGVPIKYLENYTPHIWKQSPEQVAQAFARAKKTFGFAKERTVPTIEEGLKIGLTPKYKSVAQDLGEYSSKLEKFKANVELLNDLKQSGLVVDASIGSKTPGFKPIFAEGLPKSTSRVNDEMAVIGQFYAPSEIADTLNRVFAPPAGGKLAKAAEYGAKASGLIQDLTLSGGLPATPLNSFTVAQMTKELLSGRVYSPLKAIALSFSEKQSRKFFRENAEQIIKMQERGIPLGTNLSIDNLLDEGTFGRVFGNGWKGFKDAMISDPTFKRFMPMLQLNFFNNVEQSILKAGKSAAEAADVAAKATKNFYGITDAGDLARRSRQSQDTISTFFFAPRYRESMINFWINNVKSMRNPLSAENRSNTFFVLGAVASYVAMDKANKALTGRHLHENPPGKEDKLLVPLGDGTVVGVPFLSSIATVPRNLAYGAKALATGDMQETLNRGKTFLSGLARTPFDILTNENYFGQPIYKEGDTGVERGKKIGLYAASQLAHPYMKTGVTTGQPGYQTVSKGLELPFRFYNQDQLALSDMYADAKKAGSGKATKGANGIVQTKKGDFAYRIDDKVKYADTREEAVLNLTKDKFKKSDKNFEEYGDSVFRKNKNGDVTVQPKLEFEEQLSTALLTKFKKEGDYAKWRETAEMRGRQLKELIRDPSIDELERIKLENEFATLEESYAKYKNYGGKFKKGKKGKKAKIVKASGDVTTASQLIKFARPSAPKSKKIALNSPRVKLASLKAPKPQSSKITPVSGRRIKIKK